MSAYTRAVQDATNVGGDDVGFSLKKTVKSVGKGIGRGGKSVGKGAYGVTKAVTKAAVATPMGVLNLHVKAGKLGLKGGKAAVNFARRNPKTVAAAMVPGLGLPLAAVVHRRNKRKQAAARKRKNRPLPTGDVALNLRPSTRTSMAASMPGINRPMLSAAPQRPASVVPLPRSQPLMDTSADEMAAMDYEGEGGPESQLDAYSAEDFSSASADDGGQAFEDAGNPEDEATDEDEGDEGSENDDIETEVSGMDTEYVGLDEIGLDEIGNMAPQGNPRAGQVIQKGYTRKRRQVVGFASAAAIAAATQGSAIAQPQTLFRGRKLIIPSTLAPNFLVDNIQIGVQSQFAAASSIPGESFLPQTTGDDNLTMDTCNPGIQITILATNVSGAPLQFRAAMFGDSYS